MNETDNSDGKVAADENELNPGQTSGTSPPSRTPILRRRNWLEERRFDERKMSRYIARCVPDDGVRIALWEENADYPPTIADISTLWVEGEVEILIDSNDPEEVDLDAVYRHFRWKDMTLEERWRHLTYAPQSKQVGRPISLPPVPQWNSDLRTLCFCGNVVKQFKQPARNQITVLAAFEEERWPSRIDDPLSGVGEQRKRLNETIFELNQSHRSPGLLRFAGDGSGEGIIWTALRSD